MSFIKSESTCCCLKFYNPENTSSVTESVCHKGVSRKTLSITLVALGVIVLLSGVLFLTLSSPAIPVTSMLILGISAISIGVVLLTTSIMLLASSRLSEHFDKRKALIASLLNRVSSLDLSANEKERELIYLKEKEAALIEALQVKENFIDELETKVSANKDRLSAIHNQFKAMKLKSSLLTEKLEITERLLQENENRCSKEKSRLCMKNQDLQEKNRKLEAEMQELLRKLTSLKNKELELEQILLVESKGRSDSKKSNEVIIELNSRLIELVQENYFLKDKLDLLTSNIDQKESLENICSSSEEEIYAPSFVVTKLAPTTSSPSASLEKESVSKITGIESSRQDQQKDQEGYQEDSQREKSDDDSSNEESEEQENK